MCLIITIIMIVLAAQNLMQTHWVVGGVQLVIALGLLALLIRNIIAARNQKQGCSTTGCGMTDWLTTLFKKKED